MGPAQVKARIGSDMLALSTVTSARPYSSIWQMAFSCIKHSEHDIFG